MVNSEITDYIKNEIAKGTTLEVIIASLKSNGWTDDDIKSALLNQMGAPTEEEKKLRKKHKWILFAFWMLVAVIFSIGGFIFNNAPGVAFPFLLACAVVAYIASAFSTRNESKFFISLLISLLLVALMAPAGCTAIVFLGSSLFFGFL